MNENAALENYFVFGFLTLVSLFALLCVFKFFSSYKKLKKDVHKANEKINLAEYENTFWQVVFDLLKKVAYISDFKDNLDLTLNYTLKTIDGYFGAYLLKDPRGFLFSGYLLGNVSRPFINKSKELLVEKYFEFLGLAKEDLLAEEKIRGGQVVQDIENSTLSFISDFLYYQIVPIYQNSELIGVLGVFGNSEKIQSPNLLTLLSKLVELVSYFTLEYKSNLSKELGRIESLFQSMNEGVILIDKKLKVNLINSSALFLLGYKEESPPESLSELLTAVGLNLPFEQFVCEVFEFGKSRVIKRVYINNLYLGFNFIPVSSQKEIIGVGIVISNDSEEERLNNLREDFTAMVVHELRAPLTVIRGSADMILQNKDKFSSQDIDLFLNQIKNSAWDLLKLVNDILDSAKIESGKFTVNLEPCDINEILRKEVENYRVFAESKNIDLVVDLAENLPLVKVDKEKIVQVLNNLLSNAFKFTYKGEITRISERGFVKVGSRIQDDKVQIFVVDNGPGIPDNLKRHLFNKFVQFRESAVSNESGTGLGLAISKGIVEAHGGSIWVEDNVPRGSVFVFSLPIN